MNKLREWEKQNLPELSTQEKFEKGYALLPTEVKNFQSSTTSIQTLPRRTFWQWLCRLWPIWILLFACIAQAETLIVDQWGTIVARYPRPTGFNVIVPYYDPSQLNKPPNWPFQTNSIYGSRTATPAPVCSPAPYFPYSTPAPSTPKPI